VIDRFYSSSDKKLNFKFVQNDQDFIVNELPINFSGHGNFIIIKVKKSNIDTWELIDRLSKYLGVFSNEVGYAGLKDKRATTTQYISIPKKYSKELKAFKSSKIKILESTLHNSKLNIGDLEGNRFKINLHDVEIEELNQIQKVIKQISKKGMPNYFGYQRFGKDVDENLAKAKDLVYGETIVKDKKLSKMLISAYQSSFFNTWLVHRLKESDEGFKLFNGDVLNDFKRDKLFTPKIITDQIIKDFQNQKVSPTGLLPGRKVFRAQSDARVVEEAYDDMYVQEKGYRRDAIVFPKDITCKYNSKEKMCTLEFSLPKGSYATVLIENIANRNL
jgi:tRNA pseudouridine13 synthase